MCQYIFGAVCPKEQKAASNAATKQLHFDEISLHIPEGKYEVIIIDRAEQYRKHFLIFQ